MKLKIAATLIVSMMALTVSMTTPAKAETISSRGDRASYVPGDAGTLYVTIVNDSPSDTLELRNITVYFPWAQLVDGKWPTSGANVSVNLNPWKVLGSGASGNNIHTETIAFSIPSWFAGSLFGIPSNCPNSNGPRYGLYTDCVMVGTTGSPSNYSIESNVNIPMALPTYAASSLVSIIIPAATLVVLVIATAFLAMTWSGIKRLEARK